MAASASRHFAYAIGQGDPGEVKRWFNAAFSIHLCLAAGLVLSGWPVGEYVIENYLTIPENRVESCLWVFRISLAATFFSMVSVPFIAMFTAKQHISEIASWGMLQSFLTFILAFVLTRASGDRLVFYACGMAMIPIFVRTCQIFRAVFLFRECTVEKRYWFDKNRLKEIFSFAIWNLIGSLGALLRNQGSAILLNIFFGPKVNAAYGIANQVSAQTNQLSAAMMGAFSPEITSCEGRGERERMLSLSLRSTKFATILILLFAIPLMIETEYVLKLWLRQPPEYTAMFCRLILSTFLIDRLTSGYMLAVSAHGRIAAYQATLGTILVLTLPLGWLFLKLGYPPTSVGIAFIITMTVCSLGRVLWVQKLLRLPATKWLTSVLLPCSLVATASLFSGLLARCFLSESLIRLAVTTTGCIVISLVTTWLWALDAQERGFISRVGKRIKSKIVLLAV
jgi:O-antigen/teichoic acid export membrane protein